MRASGGLNMSHVSSGKKNPTKTVGNYWGPCKIDAGAKISPKRGGHCSMEVFTQKLQTLLRVVNPQYCKETNVVIDHVN